MKTEGGKRIYTRKELQQVIQDGIAKNTNANPEDIVAYVLSQDNIYVIDGNTVSDIKPIGTVYPGDEGLKELLSYANLSVDENENIVETPKDNTISKDDLTMNEKINLSSNFDKDKYTKIWDDELKGFDETEPFIENAKRVATAYRKLLDEKNKITDDYDSGQSGNKDVYQQKIKDISSALRDAENSPEFKYLVNHVKENGVTREDRNFSPIVSTTLTDMARHQGSLFGLQPAKDTDGRFVNWVVGDLDNSGIVRFLQGVTPQSMNSLENLPDIYSNSNKKINEYLGKNKGNKNNKNNKDNKSEDVKSNNNLNIQNSPANPKKITDKNVTDEMKFGDDVKEAGGQTYLEDRNKALATHLKLRGIETPEEIDEYLSQYSSWKNAKPEWKENTKKVLSEKMANIKTNGKVEDKKEEYKGEDINNEDIKEAVEGNKEAPIKDKIDKGVDKFRDVLKNPNEYIKKGADWLSKLQPDDESPINGVEDDIIYTKDGPTKQGAIGGNQQKEIKEKDTIQEHAEQNPSNNKYLFLDEEVKNLETNEERKKYLEEKGYKVNKDGYYEKDGTKTRVYKDGQYNPKEVKSDNGLYTKPAPRNNEIQIRLQEQGYKGPKDKNGNFIPMNEDTLNGAGDREEKKETKKTKSSPLKKANKEAKKEDKKDTKKLNKMNIVKGSETIKNLLKSKK